MQLRIKEPTLINVLRFTVALNALAERRDGEGDPMVEDAPAKSTAAEILASTPARARQEAARRTLALYSSLFDEQEAVTMAPLILEHQDGRALSAADAAHVPSDLFWTAWTRFLSHSSAATSAALGFEIATDSATTSTEGLRTSPS